MELVEALAFVGITGAILWAAVQRPRCPRCWSREWETPYKPKDGSLRCKKCEYRYDPFLEGWE